MPHGSPIHGEHQSKSDADAPVIWVVLTSERRPPACGGLVPTPSAYHAAGPRWRPLGVHRRATRVVALVIPILHPFPHVAVHVVQAPTVRFLLPDRVGGTRREVFAMPSIARQLLGVLAKGVSGCRSRPRGVLPFRL